MSKSVSTIVFVANTHEEYDRYSQACDLEGYEIGDYYVQCRFMPIIAKTGTEKPYCLVLDSFPEKEILANEDKREKDEPILSFCVVIAGAIKRLYGIGPGECVDVFVHWGGGSRKSIDDLEAKLNKKLSVMDPYFRNWRITSLSSLRPELFDVASRTIKLPSTESDFKNLVSRGILGVHKNELTDYSCNKKLISNRADLSRVWELAIDMVENSGITSSGWLLKRLNELKEIKETDAFFSLSYTEKFAALFSKLLSEGLLK